jgi:CHAT domain-containing protein
VIRLKNKEALTPVNLSGRQKNLGRAHPIVFLNACQTAAGGLALTDIGGWAKGFLSAGAAGFVGTYWSVYDDAAFSFAQSFYGGLLSGLEIGEAGRQARLATKGRGGPTWLAYTIFAHPLARMPQAT